VPSELACDDAAFWHANDVFAPAEIAVRIHHRLVCVHPYPNGNGRQTRLLADLYLHITGEARLAGAPSALSIRRVVVVRDPRQANAQALQRRS
jgi:Fic family protein